MIQQNSYSVNVTDSTLFRIKEQVANYPWHEVPDDGGWRYGTNLDYMKELCDYRVKEFDWRKQEAKINQFSHFKVRVDDIDLHFVHEIGSGSSRKPLLISHGWPGTVTEFLEIIEPLAHPERFGGNVEDAFTVVAPSLPGFAYSDRPRRPYGPRKMAEVFL